MKRILAWVLAALMLLNLCACAQTSRDTAAKEEVKTAYTAETGKPAPQETKTEEAKTTAGPTETGENTETDGPTPLMWKVTDTLGHHLYLFGTIHVGDKRNETVLTRVSSVLDSCDALAVEFDMVAYEKNTQQAMEDMIPYVLTDGSDITDYMPEDLYKRASELVQQDGIDPGILEIYNLAMWSQIVDNAVQDIYSDLDSEYAMDSLLIHHAYKKNLPVLDVESASFQMALLNSFENELYLLMIQSTLDSMDTYNDDLNELYEYWLSGDRETFWEYLANDIDEEGTEEYTKEQLALVEDYNRKLVDERNLGMRDKALEYLASGDTVFFAVGAAHMANEAGLVQLMIDAGCTVEQIQY